MNKLINQIIKTELERQQPVNWVISPIGLETMLTILIDCSSGKAKEELLRLLELGDQRLNNLKNTLSKVLQETGKHQNAILSNKNQIHHTYHYNLNDLLINDINKYTDLETKVIDDKKSFIEIINVLKFADRWKNRFYKNDRVDVFKSLNGKATGVQMIGRDNKEANGYDETYYLDEEKFEAIRLPLKQENYFFEIFLPKEQFNLRILEHELSLENLYKFNEAFKPQKHYEVFFPAFKIESQFSDLVDLMNNRDGKTLFENWDSLSKLITNDYPLKVKGVKQDIKLEVDEYGVKAEAITRILGVGSLSEAGEYIIFKADRPFLFLLRTVQNNSILLLGHYFEPSKNEALTISAKDLKVAESEKYFVNNHLKLRKIHLRGELLLGIDCLENILNCAC